MGKTHIRQKVVLSAIAGVIMIPGSVLRVSAAEETEETTEDTASEETTE